MSFIRPKQTQLGPKLQTHSAHSLPEKSPQVALFVTCLINSFRPSTAYAAINLIQAAGFQCQVPSQQACCGQPNYNNGDSTGAMKIAQSVIETFESYDFVVTASASCAGMIKNHFVALMSAEGNWQHRANALAEKTYELSQFLVNFGLEKLPVNASFNEAFAYHDSCSSLREMKSADSIRTLFKHCLPNAQLKELQDKEACCGFGGTFCVKFNAISQKMGNNKLNDIRQHNTTIAVSQDTGCNLHLDRLNNGTTDISHFANFLEDALAIPRLS